MVPRAKFVEKCRKTFGQFLTIFDVFCPARNLSKSVEKLFDTFWRFLTFFDMAPFRRPLLQSADERTEQPYMSKRTNICCSRFLSWVSPPWKEHPQGHLHLVQIGHVGLVSRPNKQRPEGTLAEDPSTKRIAMKMVGFRTAEATINIKHFRRGTHSNRKINVLGKDSWQQKKTASWEKRKRIANTLPEPFLDGF